MRNKKAEIVNKFIIGIFVSLYLMVSIISTIHVVSFFELSNPKWLAITLAVAFEIGAAASLAAIVAMDKMNKTLVWALFFVLTGMQAMGNTYYAYVNLADFSGWVELFGLFEEDLIYQKRILSYVSGAILPLVALGFIKALVDYIRPDSEVQRDLLDSIDAEDTDEDEKLVEVVEAPVDISEPLLVDQEKDVVDISEPLIHKFDESVEMITQTETPLPDVENVPIPAIVNTNSNKDVNRDRPGIIPKSSQDPTKIE